MQMEWCDGSSLASVIQSQTRISQTSLVDMMRQLAKGLYDIHSKGIIHLDLKPANILINKGTYQIADFGLASYLPVVCFALMQPREMEPEGDRAYMAPEILFGNYDKPADIFSFGLILLEIMTNIILPDNGPNWHALRNSQFDSIDFGDFYAQDLVDLVTNRMLQPEPFKRITAFELLAILNSQKL